MKITLNKLMLMLSFIPFLGISVSRYPILGAILYIIQIVFAINGYLLFVGDYIKRKKIFNGIFIFLMFLYCFIMIFSSAINYNLTVGMVYTYVVYIGIYIYYYYYCSKKFTTFIKSISSVGIIFIVINIILAVFPISNAYYYNGDEKIFLGLFINRNTISMVMIPLISLIIINSYIEYKKVKAKYWVYIVSGLIIIFLSKSTTALIIASIFIIYIIFIKKIRISFLKLTFIYIISFISIVILRLHETLFNSLITVYLGKSITLTGRTLLWDYIFEIMPKAWIAGYGNNTNILKNSYIGITEAHNGILQILLCNGVIGLIVFLLIFILAAKYLKKNRDDISFIIGSSIFIYLCIVLTESGLTLNRFGYWLFIIMAININKITSNKIK